MSKVAFDFGIIQVYWYSICILIGIIFDLIGVAVTVAEPSDFHAKATKKADGATKSIKLIKNGTMVAIIFFRMINYDKSIEMK